MKAVVVYESHWGNTAEVARAIAAGLGPDTPVLTTDEAVGPVVDEADLIVAGAPVMAFGLPSEKTLGSLAESARKAPRPPDLSHPSLRSWIAALPKGHGQGAAFETGVKWSPAGATGAIERGLEAAGHQRLAKGRRFVVKGSYGPLRDGQSEAAERWGAELAAAVGAGR
jgi:hypothetical protein